MKKGISTKAKLLLAALCIIALCAYVSWSNEQQRSQAYEAAIQAILAEDFDTAKKQIDSLGSRDYREKDDLENLVKAQQYYYKYKSVEYGLNYLKKVSIEDDSYGLMDYVSNLKAKWEPEYQAEKARKEREAARERAAVQERASNPYTGMYVSDSVRELWQYQGTDYTTIKSSSGKKIKTTKYYYRTGDYGYTIWVTDQGRAAKVSTTLYGDALARSAASNRAGSGKSSSSKSSDPYHASNYSDPEDFYEDNYDDFWDFEDAEDYWETYH